METQCKIYDSNFIFMSNHSKIYVTFPQSVPKVNEKSMQINDSKLHCIANYSMMTVTFPQNCTKSQWNTKSAQINAPEKKTIFFQNVLLEVYPFFLFKWQVSFLKVKGKSIKSQWHCIINHSIMTVTFPQNCTKHQ